VNRKILLTFALMLVPAIVLSYLASEFTILPFDKKTYHELQEEKNPLFIISMQLISDLGETSIAAVLIGISVAIFAFRCCVE
jgi:hypothetical protein